MSLCFLYNRYVIAFGLIGILAVIWNIHVAFNDDGIITGQVVVSDNSPVVGATVVLSEKTLLVTAPWSTTTTDTSGQFRFTGHNLYHFYLEASKEGVGQMKAKEFRLYFRGQNMALQEPLRLEETK